MGSLLINFDWRVYQYIFFFLIQNYLERGKYSTYRCQQLRCGRWRRDVGGELDSGTEIKITDLNGTELVRIHAQDVLRLQIPVGYAFLVQKVQPGRDLLDDLRSVVLGEAHVLLDAGQQRSAIYLLKH